MTGLRRWLSVKTCKRNLKASAAKRASLIDETREALLNKSSSAVEITKQYLDRIHATEPKIHSFVTVSSEQALRQAEEIDRQVAAGTSLGPLAGIPIAVKVTIL